MSDLHETTIVIYIYTYMKKCYHHHFPFLSKISPHSKSLTVPSSNEKRQPEFILIFGQVENVVVHNKALFTLTIIIIMMQSVMKRTMARTMQEKRRVSAPLSSGQRTTTTSNHVLSGGRIGLLFIILTPLLIVFIVIRFLSIYNELLLEQEQ